MDKLWAIIKREYLVRIRSRGFIIGTALSPLLMAGMSLVPWLVSEKTGNQGYRLVVLDQSGDAGLYPRLAQVLTVNQKQDSFEVRRETVVDPAALAARSATLNQELNAGTLDAFVVIPAGVLKEGRTAYHAKNISDFERSGHVRDSLEKVIIERRMSQAGINPAQVEAISQNIEMETINASGERERGQTFFLAYVLLLILYLTILIYGVMVMRGVIEEKQSRIVEVLLSSVKPFQLMLGKLIGIGLVGLTQYLIWVTCATLLSSLAAAQALAFGAIKLPKIPFSLLIFFVVYFVLGYFLYATLYATVGAMVSSEEDGQQMQMPVTMTIVVPMALSSVVLRNPSSAVATMLSLFPFFGPVLMFLRISIQPPPWWQIALSLSLLVGTILGCVWIASKIYRVGVLMYGKRPTLPELIKWLKYT